MKFTPILFWICLVMFLLSKQDPETNKGLVAIAIIFTGVFLWWLFKRKTVSPQKDTGGRPITVSVNYRDRNSPSRWLVQDRRTPEIITPFKAVIALDVRFVRSKDYSEGFICIIIAECRIAIGRDHPVDALEDSFLFFDHKTGFFTNKHGRTAVTCDELILLADGRMCASGVQYR